MDPVSALPSPPQKDSSEWIQADPGHLGVVLLLHMWEVLRVVGQEAEVEVLEESGGLAATGHGLHNRKQREEGSRKIILGFCNASMGERQLVLFECLPFDVPLEVTMQC